MINLGLPFLSQDGALEKAETSEKKGTAGR
jgi:hypothetical protein